MDIVIIAGNVRIVARVRRRGLTHAPIDGHCSASCPHNPPTLRRSQSGKVPLDNNRPYGYSVTFANAPEIFSGIDHSREPEVSCKVQHMSPKSAWHSSR